MSDLESRHVTEDEFGQMRVTCNWQFTNKCTGRKNTENIRRLETFFERTHCY